MNPNPNTTHAMAAASGGFVGALVVIICFCLSKKGIDIPGEVSAAMMVVLTPLVHITAQLVVDKLGVTLPLPVSVRRETVAVAVTPPVAAPSIIKTP